MNVTASVLAGSRQSCEDTVGAAGDLAWVIDGATPAEGTCAEYVHALSCAIETSQQTRLSDLLAEAIEETRTDEFTAAVGIVRFGDVTDMLVLGDVSIHWLSSRLHLLADRRLETVALREREAFRRGEISRAELVEAEARKRNQDGGYWIAGNDPSAAYQALTMRTVTGTALLSTDGADGIPSWIIKRVLEHGSELGPALRGWRRYLEQFGEVDDMAMLRASLVRG